MSEVLLEFAQPLLGANPSEAHQRAVLDQMILLWNLALMSEEAQARYWAQIEAQLTKGLPADVAPAYLREMRAWLRWRKSHYAHDRRAIAGYEFKPAPDGPRLSVQFTDPKPNP